MLVLSSVLDVERPTLRVEAEPARLQNGSGEVRGAYCCQLGVEGLRNQRARGGWGGSFRGCFRFPTWFDNQDALEKKQLKWCGGGERSETYFFHTVNKASS